MSQHFQIPRADREAATHALLRLDPTLSHTPGQRRWRSTFGRALGAASEGARKDARPAKPTALYPRPACGATLERFELQSVGQGMPLERIREMLTYRSGIPSGNDLLDEQGLVSPGRVVAADPVLAALAAVVDATGMASQMGMGGGEDGP